AHHHYRDYVYATDSILQDGGVAVKAVLESRDDAPGWVGPATGDESAGDFCDRTDPAGRRNARKRAPHAIATAASNRGWIAFVHGRRFAFSFGFRGRTTSANAVTAGTSHSPRRCPVPNRDGRILTLF